MFMKPMGNTGTDIMTTRFEVFPWIKLDFHFGTIPNIVLKTAPFLRLVISPQSVSCPLLAAHLVAAARVSSTSN